jgi:glycerol-3-phosphate dehydrogenase (NAD+)
MKSCGVADLIATGYGGRNRLCSEEFAKRTITFTGEHDSSKCEICARRSVKSPDSVCALWQEIERDMLHGQKLQGVSTCNEVIKYLDRDFLKHHPHEFPLFRSIHRIVTHGECCHTLFSWDNLYQ